MSLKGANDMRLKRIITLLLVLSFALTILSACGKANDEQTNDADNNEYKLEKPSRELQKQFVEEYSTYYYGNKYSTSVSIRYWLGSFGDISFLYVFDKNIFYEQKEQTDIVADYKFAYSNSQSIIVWIDGNFLSIENAYEQELITKEMVEKIAEVWEQKRYITFSLN